MFGEPKYWSETEGIQSGVEPCPTPISLKSLCGTYSWVFDGDSQEECEETDFGFFELSLPPGKRPLPASFTGYVKLGTLESYFHGLKKAINGEKIKMNYWDIKSLKWEEEEEGHRFGATKVVDDNGNPSIEFLVDRGYVGWPPHQSMYLAKKREDENFEEELTDEERERLGIYMGDEEVIKLTKRVKRKKMGLV
ncbi:hypothetical protein PILCRDRAFT_8512 [Piloderma croceum F 1598]|uniref:Uncharacterized protein n=1 Tax=Piloderma croceum (strain F 1598) TaxID=765440 RepID=A0A0C3FRU8_PILCF|nr:hypothetical protein PILCRDRAFT_8512 [Piloderma croceum F 1598]